MAERDVYQAEELSARHFIHTHTVCVVTGHRLELNVSVKLQPNELIQILYKYGKGLKRLQLLCSPDADRQCLQREIKYQNKLFLLRR